MRKKGRPGLGTISFVIVPILSTQLDDEESRGDRDEVLGDAAAIERSANEPK